jgi:hypothetical protein
VVKSQTQWQEGMSTDIHRDSYKMYVDTQSSLQPSSTLNTGAYGINSKVTWSRTVGA